MAWAIRQQVVKARSSRHVLLLLANCANEDGCNAFPSVARLAEESGLSERGVQAALRDLLDAGVIRLGNRKAAQLKIKRWDRCPTVYDIVMDGDVRGEAIAPRPESRGEDAAPRRAPRGEERSPRSESRGEENVSRGVQKSDSRGAATAPDPSIEPSENPSNARARESHVPSSAGIEGALKALRPRVGEGTWASWIRPLRVVSLDPPIVEAPSRFHANHVRQHFAEGLEELLGRKIDIVVAAKAHGVRVTGGEAE